MKVPVSWLREYVDFDWPLEQLAAKLVFTSCEVDRIVHRGVSDVDGNLGHFLVGKVRRGRQAPERRPAAALPASTWARASRARSSAARGTSAPARPSRSRCPAPCCPARSEPLGEAKLRGETSRGMILSERELELGDDHSGIMVLADGLEPGTPLADVLPLTETCSRSRPASTGPT